ncbi:MAG: ferredoxin family protein [Bilophila wadsworthia]|jgi:2-oxoglutarate ferredoxin oxidoreductase subunit delta|nr:4Fe-4S binding protein [Bilophila wadsworthia]
MESVSIRRAWCKGCGICVAFCPRKVLGLDSEEKAIVAEPELCVACGLCELYCPDLAITCVRRGKEPQGEAS